MPLPVDSLLADGQDGEDRTAVTVPSTNLAKKPRRHGIGGLLAPLRVRNFRLLLGGQTVSNLGDVFYAVALPWLVLTRGNGAQELGLVLGAYGVSRICTTALGGVLSDRLGPRRIMLFADIGRALLVTILTVLIFWRGYLSFWQLCAITIPLGAFAGLFWPANYAIMPELLTDDTLQAGNATNISSRQLTSLLGFGIAGAVISSLQLGTAMAVDAVSFVLSAITLAIMRLERKAAFATPSTRYPSQEEKGSSPTEEKLASTEQLGMTFWQLLRGSRLFQLALLIVVMTGLTFDGMMQVALPALAHGVFATGASGYGMMLAAFSGGALVGGVTAGSLGHLRRRGLVALVMLFLEAGAIASVPFAGGVPGAALALAAAGLANGLAGILFLTLVQQLLPRHLHGRIMAAIVLANDGLYPVSVVLAGAVTAHWSAVAVFPLSGLAILIAGIFGLLQPESREVDTMKVIKSRGEAAGVTSPPVRVGTQSRRKPRPVIGILNLIASLIVASGIIYFAAAGAGPLPSPGQTFNPGTGVWTAASDAQTPTDETLHLPGLTGPVHVTFEANGTPHINASSDHDLFLTMGYLHAEFRLFQMDLMRREGEGLLSAIVGKNAIQSDEFEDQLGLVRTAQSEWAQMGPDDPGRQALVAYTQGVNAIIKQEEQTGHLPLMFKMLGYQPAPWTPIDSLVIQGVETQTLSYSTTALDYALMVKSLGYERTMQWFPVIPINEQHPYDPGPYKQSGIAPLQGSQSVSDSEEQAVLAVLDEYSALPPTAVHHGSNSNAWVVDGTKTASGKPIMAGDPHLEHTLPAIWYQLEGQSPHYQFSGVSIPGIPVVIIGYNAHISWSLTNGQDQLTFYYQEKTDAAHPHQYFWNGAWHSMQQIHYSIPVKGGKTDNLTVELTVHGPIITQHGQTMAVWWAGALPSRNLDAMLNVLQASNYQQFRDALRIWHAPSQTFIYADDKGNIGQISAGFYPILQSGRPWLPMSGTGESDVIGSIPFDALPQVYDPPSHFIVAGNQRPVDATYPYYIGTAFEDFDPGWRSDQIYHRLSEANHITVADMEKLQMDTHEYLAQVIVPKLVAALDQGSLTPQEQQALELMRSWDFDMNVNSAAATIWNTFLNQYAYDVFDPWWVSLHVPQDQAPLALKIKPTRGASATIGQFEDLQVWTVSDPTNPTFSLPNGTKRTAPEVMRQSFAKAMTTLTKKFGSNPQRWTWGKAHLFEIPSLVQIPSLGYGPFPQGGSGRVINASNTSNPTSGIATGGPSWRIIMDWSTGTAIGVFPGGESENPLSPWYENQIKAWQDGQYYPMLTGDQARDLNGAHVWTLQPQ